MIGRLAVVSGLMLLWSQPVSADVVELTDGERVEGALTEATPAGVLVEVGGQRIRFEVSKVRAIYFGPSVRPPAQPETTAPPLQPAKAPTPAPGVLNLLQSLRSAVGNGIGLREYEAQVNHAVPLVTFYVAGSPAAPGAEAMQDAMRYYVLAEWAWNNQGTTSRTVWLKKDEVLTRCSDYQTFAREMQTKGEAYYAERMKNYLAIADGVIPVLWSCAADKIAEAEKLTVNAKK
jgi:hypothetical protein